MAQNEIQNILTRYRLGLIAAPSPCSYTSSIPSNHIPPSYSSSSSTLTDSPSLSPSTVDTQYTTEPERQEEVGTFADILPEAWKMSNDVQWLQYNVINKRFVYLLIYLLFTFMNSPRLSYIASHTSGIKLEIDDFETLKKYCRVR